MAKKNIMRTFTLNEISAVDSPAQEGAGALIMKRDAGKPVEKKFWLTDSVDGHSHLINEQDFEGRFRDGGDTSWSQSPGDDHGHSHPWIRNPDGTITIGEANGHSHEIAQVSKFKNDDKAAAIDSNYPIKTRGDLEKVIKDFGKAVDKPALAKHIASRAQAMEATDLLPAEGELARYLEPAGPAGGAVGKKEESIMTDKTKSKAGDEGNPDLEKLQKENARFKALAEMNDAQKAHFEKLDDDGQSAFIAMSSDERQSAVDTALEKAADEDPVVYTAEDGTEYRKSDDQRLVKMAKQSDEDRAARKKADEEIANQRLRKSAEEDFKYLPGDVETRMELIKAAESISDKDKREAALKSLKGQNDAMKKAFETAGVDAGQIEGSAVAKLDTLAKNYAKENKCTFHKAYSEVCKTPEGKDLYKESLQEAN